MKNQQAELVDLVEEERVRPKICTPKIIILSILSLAFVCRNVYYHFAYPIVHNPNDPVPEVDEEANSRLLWERMSGYAIVAVVFFVGYYFLKQANDDAEIKKLEEIKRKEEEEEEREKQLQREREEKLFKKMEEQQAKEAERQQRIKLLNQQAEQQHRDQSQEIKDKTV